MFPSFSLNRNPLLIHFVSSSNGKGIVAKGVFFLLFSECGTEVGHLLLEAFDEFVLGGFLALQ